MCPFVAGEPKGVGDGVEDGVGDMGAAALFEADVVVDADTGQLGELFSAQSGHPAPGGHRLQTHILRTQSGPPGAQELTQRGVPFHEDQYGVRPAGEPGSAGPRLAPPRVDRCSG